MPLVVPVSLSEVYLGRTVKSLVCIVLNGIFELRNCKGNQLATFLKHLLNHVYNWERQQWWFAGNLALIKDES